MDQEALLAIVFRWAHVLSAVALVGGLLFQRLVSFPAAEETLDVDHARRLRAASDRRWKPVVMISTALLLLSGVYNFLTISIEKADSAPAYHGLFGVKFILALLVFFLAGTLTGRAAAFEGMRRNARTWIAVAALAALAVVLVSGVLKNLG